MSFVDFDLGSIFSAGGEIIDDLVTSDEERLQMDIEDRKLDIEEKKIDADLIKGQLEINKIEASHKSIFVAGWRPAIGWIGVFSLGYQFILYPMLVWIWFLGQAKEWIPNDLSTPPILDTSALMTLLTGMLGIAVMRSYDKAKGTSTDKI